MLCNIFSLIVSKVWRKFLERSAPWTEAPGIILNLNLYFKAIIVSIGAALKETCMMDAAKDYFSIFCILHRVTGTWS